MGGKGSKTLNQKEERRTLFVGKGKEKDFKFTHTKSPARKGLFGILRGKKGARLREYLRGGGGRFSTHCQHGGNTPIKVSKFEETGYVRGNRGRSYEKAIIADKGVPEISNSWIGRRTKKRLWMGWAG